MVARLTLSSAKPVSSRDAAREVARLAIWSLNSHSEQLPTRRQKRDTAAAIATSDASTTAAPGDSPLGPHPAKAQASERACLRRGRAGPARAVVGVNSVELPQVREAVRPPPSAPPTCDCGQPAAWRYKRWLCASEGCGYEIVPPPVPLAPLCGCSLPCTWSRGRWWCVNWGELGSCGFEGDVERSSEEPALQQHRNLEMEAAVGTASLLTAEAYGLSGATRCIQV